MNQEIVTRTFALYLPLSIAVLLGVANRRRAARVGAAVLLACLWNILMLLPLNLVALRMYWWKFSAHGAMFMGVPVDLYLGWVLMWGAIPVLAFRSLPIGITVAAMAGADILFMPQMAPVLQLGPHWLLGEGLALLLALVPGLLLARWTERQIRLPFRAAFQAVIFAGFCVWLFPSICGANWDAIFDRPVWAQSLAFQLFAVPVIFGMAALKQFCIQGKGTPLPFDPPRRLVMSGPCAYVSNPMQLATAVLLLMISTWLQNVLVGLGALVTFAYGVGIASWDESNDLQRRFGQRWVRYRHNVRNWRMRWRPWHPSLAHSGEAKAKLYVAEFCGPCSEVRQWFESRHPVGLMMLAAEDHPTRDLRRILYVSEYGDEREGVDAVAAALQHINLGWAAAGWMLELPVLCHFIQLLMDATGISEPKGVPQRIVLSEAAQSELRAIEIDGWLVANYFHEESAQSFISCTTSSVSSSTYAANQR
jgi:protein-S-isoprenylcysteine O-methyltransferase Ste14